jgi:hypothetical protein
MNRRVARVLLALAVSGLIIAGPGCSDIPFVGGEEPETGQQYPPEIQEVVTEIDRLQSKGELRAAIELTERSLVDYPDAVPLRVRLSELRSQRQVCFMADWNEVDSLQQKRSFAMAVVVLKRIERYGDKDMVRRARERIDEIRAGNPAI